MQFTEQTPTFERMFDIERILAIWNSVVAKEYFAAHLFQLFTVT